MEREKTQFSIIIPTYNRVQKIDAAIDSALLFSVSVDSELIIVDDGSTDNSYEYLQQKYKTEIESKQLTISRLEKNVGVTGARNHGVTISKGKWILFLDSDDTLIPNVSSVVLKTIEDHTQNCSLFFFRCIDENGILIGPRYEEDEYYDLKEYLNKGTPGECLAILPSDHILNIPYESDLRGFESITYAKHIQKYGPCMISPFAVRKYITSDDDRLCEPRNISKRGYLLSKGYIRFLILFHAELDFKQNMVMLVKSGYHFSRWCISKFSSIVPRG